MANRITLLEIKVGFFVTVALAIAALMILLVGSRSQYFQDQNVYYTMFSNVSGLVEGAPVRLAGRDVGRVTQISFPAKLEDRQLTVEMKIDQAAARYLREDSKASIKTAGLLGDKFVEIEIGSHDHKELAPGAHLVNVEPPDFYNFVPKGQAILDNTIDISLQVKKILEGLLGGEEGSDLVATIGDLREIVNEVKKGEGPLHSLIYGEDIGEIQAILKELEGAVGSLNRIVTQVEKGEGTTLHTLLYGKDEANLVANVNTTLLNLNEVMGEIKGGQGFLGALISDPKGQAVYQDLATASRTLREVTGEIKTGRGLLNALVYDEESARLMKNLTGASHILGELLAQVREGGGPLHTLVYGDETDTGGLTDNLLAASASIRSITEQIEKGDGVLHDLVFGKGGGKPGSRLAAMLANLEHASVDIRAIAGEVRRGKGMAHNLVYDREAGRLPQRIEQVMANLETLTTDIKESRGLLNALIYNPKAGDAIKDLAQTTASLRRVAQKLEEGEGTLGALIADPTVYEDLKVILDGAKRSELLKAVIRFSIEKRQGQTKPAAHTP